MRSCVTSNEKQFNQNGKISSETKPKSDKFDNTRDTALGRIGWFRCVKPVKCHYFIWFCDDSNEND